MSLKKEMVRRFSFLPDIKGLDNNKLILTTPLGIIVGRFPTDKELEDTSNINAALATIGNNIYDEYKTGLSLSESDSLPGDEGYLYLVDVEIKSSNNSYRLPFMVLFYDQIIGVSIGSI